MKFNEWWIEYDTTYRIAGFHSRYGAAVGCAEAAWNAAIASVKNPPNEEATDVCLCCESIPYSTGKYAGHCKVCGLPIPMPR